MKRLLAILIMLFCFGFFGQAQDTIVTTAGDTIACKITRVSTSFIHFSVFDKSSVLLMRSRLPLSTIQFYEQADDQTAESPLAEPEPEIISNVYYEDALPSFRLATNGGFTYQFGGYDRLPQSYRTKAQTLWNVGGEFHYFLSDKIGVGIRYTHYTTSIDHEFEALTPQGIRNIRLEGETIRFNHLGLGMIYRFMIYDDRSINYFMSSGLINYRTSGLIDGNYFEELGEAFCITAGISYDFFLSDHFGVGLGAEVTIAKISEIEYNGAPVNVDFPISRIDLVLGLRLFQ